MSGQFWNIPDVVNSKTPLSIFKEIGAELTQQTEGLLVGYTGSSSFTGSAELLFIDFGIMVPALNKYTLKVFRYEQPLLLFPGTLRFLIDQTESEISSEESLISRVTSITQSDEMRKILVSLLSQAKIAVK